MISQQQLKTLLQERKIGQSAPEVLYELPEGPIFCVLIKKRSRPLNQWQRARDLVAVTGFYPVLADSKETMIGEIIEECLEPKEIETTGIVRQAQEMDAMQILAKYLNPPGDRSGKTPAEVFSITKPEIYLPWINEILGPWPENVVDPEDFSRSLENQEFYETFRNMLLCFLPVEQSWEVPALLRFGGWNDCPLPVEHTCIHLSWYKRYGAEIVTLCPDGMEMFVPHPPTTLQECRRLALEHLAYNADGLSQEGWSLTDLVAHLSHDRFWHFWWD